MEKGGWGGKKFIIGIREEKVCHSYHSNRIHQCKADDSFLCYQFLLLPFEVSFWGNAIVCNKNGKNFRCTALIK